MSPRSRTLLKWLTPGIGVKRWIAILILGAGLIGLSLALFTLQAYRTQPDLLQVHLTALLRVPLWLWGIGVGLVGLAIGAIAVIRINQAILRPLEMAGYDVIDAMVEHKRGQQGPKVVAIGGGTGMPTLLRGLKNYSTNLTAIVTVADDGGSSGRLRRDLGVIPPGDFRNNIAALARDEGLMTQLFQYRFGEGGLEGHSFGNLFITALSAVTGSFEQALVESSRVLAIRGRVLPSTLADVTLTADLRESDSDSARRVSGESAIPERIGSIERIFLQPDDVPAYPESIQAILSADLIVIGPGSLFTSILPNLLVRGIAQALRSSTALKVYVCNVATQRGETEGFSVQQHIKSIERHAGSGLFDVVLANSKMPALPPDSSFAYVEVESPNGTGKHTIKSAPLIDDKRPWRHDSTQLGKAIMDLLTDHGKLMNE